MLIEVEKDQLDQLIALCQQAQASNEQLLAIVAGLQARNAKLEAAPRAAAEERTLKVELRNTLICELLATMPALTLEDWRRIRWAIAGIDPWLVLRRKVPDYQRPTRMPSFAEQDKLFIKANEIRDRFLDGFGESLLGVVFLPVEVVDPGSQR